MRLEKYPLILALWVYQHLKLFYLLLGQVLSLYWDGLIVYHLENLAILSKYYLGSTLSSHSKLLLHCILLGLFILVSALSRI
jgi:hypothetical protein